MPDELRAYQRLLEASRTLQSCRDVELVGDVLISMLQTDFEFDGVVVALIEGPVRLMRGFMARPDGLLDLSAISWPLHTSNHPWTQIAQIGEIVSDRCVEPDDPRFEGLHLAERIWEPTWMPLVAKGEPIGLILAFNRGEHRQVPEGRRAALTLLANHVALSFAALRPTLDDEDEAVRDVVTGLYNRRHFDRALEREVRRFRRYSESPALLMIDLNDFKAYNDTHGHHHGDQVLRMAADLIKRNIRETDLVARYGGDEFVVLMPNASDTQARAAINRILAAVEAHNRTHRDDAKCRFTLSIGHHVADCDDAERVLQVADLKMYESKDDGSSRRLLHQLISPRDVPVGHHARLIFGLMRSLQSKDPEHLAHSRRVMGYAVMICETLGLSRTRTEQIAIAAILHDLGKVVINAEILRRPGPLSDPERMLIRSHPIVTSDMLGEIPFLEGALRLIRHHCERWDGRTHGDHPGFPTGLSGETIPLGSRIIRVADLFDTLLTERPWRRALTLTEAIAALRDEAGKSLDPNLLRQVLPAFESLEQPISADEIRSPLPS